MKKRISRFISMITIASSLCIGINPVFAEDGDADQERINPNGIGCTPYDYYTESSQYYDVTDIVTATAVNNTAAMQSLHISKERTISYYGNVSASYTRELMRSKVGLQVEIGYGAATTTTYQTDVNVPAYTTYYCDIGSNRVKTSGTYGTVEADCSRTSSNGWIQYTYGQYVQWRS